MRMLSLLTLGRLNLRNIMAVSDVHVPDLAFLSEPQMSAHAPVLFLVAIELCVEKFVCNLLSFPHVALPRTAGCNKTCPQWTNFSSNGTITKKHQAISFFYILQMIAADEKDVHHTGLATRRSMQAFLICQREIAWWSWNMPL